MSIVVVGSANIDVQISGDRIPAPGETVFANSVTESVGGKGLNQAVAASRAGADVTLFCSIGSDDAGKRIAEFLSHEEISFQSTIGSKLTGRAYIQMDSEANNSISVYPGANVAIDSWPDGELALSLRNSYFLVMQMEVSAALNHSAAVLAKQFGATVVLTPAPVENVTAELLELTDVLILNQFESSLLGGNQDPFLAAQSLSAGRTLLLTLGDQGAQLYKAGQLIAHAKPAKLKALDTTGAGDCFSGSYVAAKTRGYSDEDALHYAVAASGLSVQTLGAAPSMPTVSEIDLEVERMRNHA